MARIIFAICGFTIANIIFDARGSRQRKRGWIGMIDNIALAVIQTAFFYLTLYLIGGVPD